MSREPSPQDRAKRAAAEEALTFIESGMKLGLGTGSTAAVFVKLLGERVKKEGLKVTGVPTSIRTGELAEACGIRLTTLNQAGWLDVTVDGADEFDDELRLIKGGGGALLQEKIVACASDQMVVVADASKQVRELGAFPLPVEVVPFGWQVTQALISETLEDFDVGGDKITLRLFKDEPFLTDEGNFILDLQLRRIGEPEELAAALNLIPGVIESGLFINVADVVVIGREDGTADIIEYVEDEDDD
jgi:ribose 5-phosphate isomerase A